MDSRFRGNDGQDLVSRLPRNDESPTPNEEIMASHDHENEEDTYGIALGFRILDEDGKLYLAEAEVAPYVDAPDELGVTLVFHPLDGINPVEVSDDVDWPSWPLDIDDDL